MPRCRLLKKILVAGICLVAPVVWGDTLTYSDNFESSSINSFWTINQQLGAVELSTNQNHTPGGSQSLEFAPSSTTGQHDMSLTHTFSTATQGNFSVWFYDNGESFSDQTYYNMLALGNGGAFPSVFVGTQDFDPTCYETALDTTSGRTGPNANCGPFPGAATTDVPRTTGWHEFEIDDSAASLIISIDGTQVLDVSGDYSFTSVSLHEFGPENSTTPSYWDDFNAVTTSAVPEPSTLGALAILFGSLVTRRRGWSKPR